MSRELAATRAKNCKRPWVFALLHRAEIADTGQQFLMAGIAAAGCLGCSSTTDPGINKFTQSTWHSEERRPIAGRSTVLSGPLR